MFRVLAWRFAFDAKNIQTIFHTNGETIKYFAFGANLDPDVLVQRRRIKPISEKEFILHDYELKFSHPSAWDGEGFASIDSAPGKKTYGKLYTLRKIDAIRLDYYELVYFLNRYKRVEVEQDGEKFFFYQTQDPRPNLDPWHAYKKIILKGFENVSHVPKGYLDELRAIPEKTARKPAEEINFLYRTSNKYPAFLNDAIKYADQKMLTFFVKRVRDKSFTERFINV